ncbi:hypothetical protein GJ496_006780 [Pomphorhynchus laevis]|nr:hypothetical protein GJ496_006780 [Pomphorhynchus laevis]
MIQSINLLDGAENNYHLVAKKGEQENKIADNEGSGYFIVQNGQVQYIPNVSEVQSNLGLQNILNVLDCLSNENCLKSPHTTNSPDVHSDPSTLNTESFFYKTNQKNSEKLVFANFINDRNSKKVLNKTKLPRHLVKKKKRLMKSEDTSSALNFKHILPKLSNTNTNITSSCVTRTDSSNLFNDVTAINQSTLPTISRKNKSSNAYFNQLPDNILYRATLSSTSRKKKSLNRKKKPKVVLTSAAESNMSNLKHNTIYTDPIIAEETLMENPFTQYQIQSQSFNSNFINCVGMDTETPIQQQLFIQAQEPSIFQFFACKVGAPEIIEDRKAIAYIKVYDNLPILEQQTVPSQKYVNDLFHVFQNKLILGQTDSSLDDARND